MHIDVILRTCSRSNQERYIRSSKAELMLRCITSLVRTMNHAASESPQISFALHVLDDNSDDVVLEHARHILSRASFPTTHVPMEHTGQSASMRFAVDYALAHCTELMYFVEDDYIHELTALDEIIDAYTTFSTKLGRSVIISPCDHVTEYRPPDVNTRGECRIVTGKARHWRTTKGTTSTYLIDQRIFRTYLDLYLKHAEYEFDPTVSENTTINRIYYAENCFSPIPSLAAHISHPDLQPPFVDFMRLWEESDPRISLN